MNVTHREEYVPLTPQQLQVLLALAHKPMYGYGLSEQIHEDSGGVIDLGRGSIYATLTSLLRMDLVEELAESGEVRPGRPPRWFRLTDSGRIVLEWEVERARMVVHLGYERLGKTKNELGSSFFKGFA